MYDPQIYRKLALFLSYVLFPFSNHRPIRRYGPYQNTFLERVRISGDMSADRIICIIYMWLQKHPVSHTAKQLQLAQDTAVNWYSFCREVACAIAWHDFVPIGGRGDIVEVESRHSIKCKNNENDIFEDLNRVWIVGGKCRRKIGLFYYIFLAFFFYFHLS